MDFDNQPDEIYQPAAPRRSHTPMALGLGGFALGALAFGFVIANALAGTNTVGSSAAPEQVAPPPTEGPQPGPTEPPPATAVPPTATPVPPTPAPPITTPKFHDIFRAEGGAASKNVASALPLRRLEASWNNSYKGCPGPGCIRGRASVLAGVGPLGTGESLVASASVYNTFVAQRPSANLLMDLRWKGSLLALAGANVNTGVEIEIAVSEVDPKTGKVVKAVPSMPYTVVSKELGLEAVQGMDTLPVEGARSVNIPLRLEPGQLYRIDLTITCSTRVAFSLSATMCNFASDDGFAGVEWTRQVIEYDTGICAPSQKGEGCVYR